MLTYACLVRGCSLSEELERDGERGGEAVGTESRQR